MFQLPPCFCLAMMNAPVFAASTANNAILVYIPCSKWYILCFGPYTVSLKCSVALTHARQLQVL